MTTLQQVQTLEGKRIDFQIEDNKNVIIQSDALTLLPAVLDPHVHFRTPGLEHKEDWRTGAKAALRGGCTQVFDMPNTLPPTFTQTLLQEKKNLIHSQLEDAGIPLRYDLFFGADKQHLHELAGVKNAVVGIKVFMGCSTGNLVIDDDESLHAVFSIAAKENMLIAVHAEDEHLIRQNKKNFAGNRDYHSHSHLRNIDVATKAVAKAIELSGRYGTRLYILHVSSEDEIALIKAAKRKNLPVYAEITPHHLFFDTNAYHTLGGKAVVNPPLRDIKHREHLFNAIREKIIDTIGSDHAPHTLHEKSQKYGECPSGMPGIEFMLPLLLNANAQGLLSLDDIVSLTSRRAREIFQVEENQDKVLVDLNKVMTVSKTESKCGWTPYAGMTLQGWPVYTILRETVYKV